MPQVGAWLVATWQAGTVGSFLLRTAATLALNVAVAKITAPKGPKPRDLQTEQRDSAAQRTRHLGRVRTSGAVMFWDWSRVGNQRRLFKLLAVGQGGVTAVEQVWLNDVVVARTGDAATTAPYNGKVSIRSRSGFGAEFSGGAYSTLSAAFAAWTADHRLDGIGTVLGEFDAVKGEEIAEVYSGGDPSMTVLIRGDRCYNPATDAYAWSDNIAFQLRDVLTHPLYGPLMVDDIDLPSFTQAVADCNDAMPGGVVRYAGGGSYNLSEPVVDVAQRLCDASAGRTYLTTEGKIGFRVGKWRAPTYTIQEEHIVSLDIGPGSGEFERVTTLVPKYVAPEVDWQETTADAWDDAAAIAIYGESAARELDVPWCQNHGQARRLAKIALAKLNPSWRATLRLRFWGLLLLEEECVRLNLPELGLVNAPAWIDSFAFDMDSGEGVVTVELLAADPASFNFTAAEIGQAPSKPAPIDHTAPMMAAPVITSLTVVTDDGPPYIRMVVDNIAGPYYLRGVSYKTGEPGVNRNDLIEMTTSTAGQVIMRSTPMPDQSEYDIQIAWYSGLRRVVDLSERQSEYATVTGIDVVANTNPPADPVVVAQSGSAGSPLIVTFEPDLGANYRRTGLYRDAAGGNFGAATLVKWSYDTSAQITMTAPIPAAGARFWLRSENASGVTSDPVVVGNYPA